MRLTNAEKVTVIPNGIELPERKNNGQGKFIFAIGRFVEEKGFDDLLDALRICPQQCTIAGKADHESVYSRNLVQKAKELGVNLPGFVQGAAKEKLFLECGLFVIPSHHEGLPFALLEAMSYGCRILASDIPVHKELNLSEECYFPCGNTDILAEKLKKSVNNKNSVNSNSDNYDEILKEKYDWRVIADKTREVYYAIAN